MDIETGLNGVSGAQIEAAKKTEVLDELRRIAKIELNQVSTVLENGDLTEEGLDFVETVH